MTKNLIIGADIVVQDVIVALEKVPARSARLSFSE